MPLCMILITISALEAFLLLQITIMKKLASVSLRPSWLASYGFLDFLAGFSIPDFIFTLSTVFGCWSFKLSWSLETRILNHKYDVIGDVMVQS